MIHVNKCVLELEKDHVNRINRLFLATLKASVSKYQKSCVSESSPVILQFKEKPPLESVTHLAHVCA